MPGPLLRLAFALAPALLLAACATPRLHSRLELADLALQCGVPPATLVQEPDLRKILFLYAVGASKSQVDCVHRWARKNHLHFAYLEGVQQVEQ